LGRHTARALGIPKLAKYLVKSRLDHFRGTLVEDLAERGELTPKPLFELARRVIRGLSRSSRRLAG